MRCSTAGLVVDIQLTFARDANYQYIELRGGHYVDYGPANVTGMWGLSDGFIMHSNFSAIMAKKSVVLRSDPAGRYWNTFPGTHLNIQLPEQPPADREYHSPMYCESLRP